MMLATVGRGGDGQAIRDEILHIMHRNHIPEMKGTWMEEWHQKLHNNTTPDDVPICKAYLSFLRSNGDNGAYWRVLSDAGLTRARLESFDRPIRQVLALHLFNLATGGPLRSMMQLMPAVPKETLSCLQTFKIYSSDC
jgi:hypothetical protein